MISTPQNVVHALDANLSLDGKGFPASRTTKYGRNANPATSAIRPHEQGLQYVGLDGSVGVIANGAGLAMSTVDVVNQVGGKPANFLDIGGGANAAVMAGALEVINNDPNVRSIFINIFGGITRGEEVANGIIEALKRVSIDSPIDPHDAQRRTKVGPSAAASSDSEGAHDARRARRVVALARLVPKIEKILEKSISLMKNEVLPRTHRFEGSIRALNREYGTNS